MKLSLIIPCYNEEDNIDAFFNECKKTFDGSDFLCEYVFVNDGSADNTYTKAKNLYINNPEREIKVVNFARNFGKESAIYAGLQYATGDFICLIDADLQQHPNVVLQMIECLREDDDLDGVVAYQEIRKESKFVIFLKDTFYKLINKVTDINFVKGASDFRCFRSNVKDSILSMTEYHRFSKGIFSWIGYNFKYISYQVQERNAGESKWTISKLFKYAMEGIVAFTTAPLRIATFCGVISSFIALIYMLVVIAEKLIFDIDVPGYATIVVLLLFIGGLQLFSMGIIGEYIAKIYIQTKNRPIYIIKNVLE